MSSQTKKQSQLALLRTVLTEFDIESQVSKMATRAMEAMLRSNAHAFDFLKESEQKLAQFQARLSKSENQNDNLLASIDTRLQIANEMNSRLEQFSKQFFNSLSETNTNISSINRSYDELHSKLRAHSIRIEALDDSLKKFKTAQSQSTEKIYQSVQQVLKQCQSEIQEIRSQVNKNGQSVSELTISTAKAKGLMEAKMANIDTVAADISLYMHERQAMSAKLSDVVGEMEGCVRKAELYELRHYTDGLTVSLGQKIKDITQIFSETIERNQAKAGERSIEFNRQLSKLQKNFEEKLTSQQQSLTMNTAIVKQSMVAGFQRIDAILNSHSQSYLKHEQVQEKMNTTLTDHEGILNMYGSDLQRKTDIITEIESNILSLNDFVKQINQENSNRRAELSKLQSSSNEAMDLGEKLEAMFDQIRQQGFSIQGCTVKLETHTSELIRLSESLKSITTVELTGLNQKLINQQQQLRKAITDLGQSSQSENARVMASCNSYTDRVLSSIATQIEQMNSLYSEIRELKNNFKTQMDQLDEVNIALGDKIEKITSSILKLRSDFSLKLEGLGQQCQKHWNQMTAHRNHQQQLSNVMTASVEIINLLLSMSIVQSSRNNREAPFKTSTLLEGWMFQSPYQESKHKYRSLVVVSVREFLISVFQGWLRLTETQKSTKVIGTGKDVFRELVKNQQTGRFRSNSAIKKQQSQLPRLVQ